jgi:hypothetical protein
MDARARYLVLAVALVAIVAVATTLVSAWYRTSGQRGLTTVLMTNTGEGSNQETCSRPWNQNLRQFS